MGIFRRTTKRTVRKTVRKRTSKATRLDWEHATDVKKDIVNIIEVLELEYLRPTRIFCYRTEGSKARAYARTWMMPKIFQDALGIEPAYVIEVISKYYDKLSEDEKKRVLIHELLHIPKNFSGALLPHHGVNRHIHNDSGTLFKEYKRRTENL
jgi:predicted metallopeptidase